MASLSLKVTVVDSCVTKTMQFEPSAIVFDVCRIIREKVPESKSQESPDKGPEYGLFLADPDPKKGCWLEMGRSLEYYLLRNGDQLDYKKKVRVLKIKMLDESVKTMHIDDSQPVSQLMITICSKIGLTNHEEYSLVRELPDSERLKTLTMKRDKSIAKDQKKLDEMKKKLHTDDELDWLDHSNSLRAQGVEESEVLLLRRKYFFSDQNIDARDPIQLNLLYVQTRDAILKGAHPVSQEKAIEFAGLQCQIQFGDHVETKHKPGFIDLKEFLPKEYCKVKGIEKKIYLAHKDLQGVSEVEGKAKYTQNARSLKTYGITFFLVKEKMKGKNKLVPRLFGVTKESVVRVDENTKEIMKTWPLTTVKRWAASPNSFSLDFGDYQDNYYCVQTLEGEQISQLIAGYIDIILKKKQAKDYLGVDGDEESAMYEDSVSPAKATIVQHQITKAGHASTGSVALPAVLRSGESDSGQYSTNSMQKAQFSKMTQLAHSGHVMPTGQSAQTLGLGNAQRGLLGTISQGILALDDVQSGLQWKADLPTLGTDPASMNWMESQRDMSRQKVGSQLSAMNAATAQMVSLTSAAPDDTDYAGIGSAVQTISTNIGEFTNDVRILAALEENESEGDRLMGAARLLVGAFADLLKAAQPDSNEPRQNMLNAASKIGEVSNEIMYHVEPPSEAEKEYKDHLMTLAKKVANATAGLVLQSKAVSERCTNKQDQNSVIATVTKCALASSQLVACSRVLAPTIDNAQCQDQLVDAAKLVAKAVDDIVNISQMVCDDDATLQELGYTATNVTKGLDDIIQHVKKGITYNEGVDQVDAILTTTDRLCNTFDDEQELIRQARSLAQATSQLVLSLRNQAELQSDPEQQNKLLSAAKCLAEATAHMVEAAKGCAGAPRDEASQRALKVAAEELRSATSTAAANALKQPILMNLQQAAKNAVSAGTQLINMSGLAGKSNTNQATQQQLMTQCRLVGDEMIPRVVQALRATHKNPDSPSTLLQLVNAAQEFIPPCNKLLALAKAAGPTVADQTSALSLNNMSKNLTNALADLRAAMVRAHDTCVSPEIDGALDQVRALEQELVDTRKTAATGRLKPLPGERADTCASRLGAASKAVASAMAQLLTAALQGNDNYTGTAARDAANALRNLTGAVRGVAATTEERDLQNGIIDQAVDVMDKSANLIEEAKRAVNNPDHPDCKARLAQVAKSVSLSLNNCVNCLPGLRDVDLATRHITTVGAKLTQPQKFRATECSVLEVQLRMNTRAADLNQAASDILTACQNAPDRVAQASHRFSKIYEEFVDSGMDMAGSSKDPETRDQIVGGLRNVSVVSSRFLMATKSMLTDPSAPSAKNLLTQAARAVTESINQLINVCTDSAPGQKECDSAYRQMQMVKPILDNPAQPVIEGTFFDSLESVIEKSKALAEAMTSITTCARQGELNGFCKSVDSFANAVCGMTENAAQAAYLVGLADPLSEPGRRGLIDQTQFLRANQSIQSACSTITNPASTKEQVLQAVSAIAAQTSLLCNACRDASSKTSNPVAKKQFVQSAKDLALSTASMVKAIKGQMPDGSQSPGVLATKPLLQALEVLTEFAVNPEFISTPAKISEQGRRSQEPITSAGCSIIDGACNMIQAAKQLAVNPKDAKTYQTYSGHSHELSEAIKKIVSAIRNAAPGHKECDNAVEQINVCIHSLDQASLAAISLSLTPMTSDGRLLQAYHEQVINSAHQLLEHVDPIRNAAKGEAENLGHLVSSATSYLDPLKAGAIGCASKTVNSKDQMALLDQSKTVIESMQNLILAAKEAGGNRKVIQLHAAVDESADGAREMLQELIDTLEKAASSSGNVNALVDNLNKSLTLTDVDSTSELATFVDYQTNIVNLTKQLARSAQEMISKSVTNVQDLGGLANNLTRDYGSLATECQGAVATCSNSQMGARIKTSIQQLGTSCIGLVQDAGNLQCNPTDAFSKRDLVTHAKKVIESVTDVLTVLQSGARGTQACINAASTMNGIIADLDTTIMFASAGTLDAEAGDSFANYREGILKTAKDLVEDTKMLVAGAASNQEQLAGAAQNSVSTITRLSDCVKRGATSLGSDQPEAQILLINAVKDVASALSVLIGTTKVAAGKSPNDPSMVALKDSAKVMVTNVTSLLKTVKTVEDEAARGTQALESSIEAIAQEMKSFASTDRMEKAVTPDEIIRITRPITTATAKAVAAGNSGRQEDIIAAANIGRKAVADILKACKGGVTGTEDAQLRQRMLNGGNNCGQAYRELLQTIHRIVQKPTPENKLQLAAISKKVASAVTDIIHAAEALKGTDWVDPSDPTIIAETELLSAANSIEAAAKKLAALRPKLRPKQADESLNFEEQLLEAAKSIAAATAALVKAASMAQRELVMQGKIGAVKADLDDDSQWSQGLISAARLVATATHSLCDAANAMVQGHASEEKLISSAKQVAASTAQLLLACKVKADPNSEAMHRLQVAGNAVKKATEALVKEAQKTRHYAEEESSAVSANTRMVTDMAQIIMAQEEILKKEKELEIARRKLETIRKAKYRPSVGDDL